MARRKLYRRLEEKPEPEKKPVSVAAIEGCENIIDSCAALTEATRGFGMSMREMGLAMRELEAHVTIPTQSRRDRASDPDLGELERTVVNYVAQSIIADMDMRQTEQRTLRYSSGGILTSDELIGLVRRDAPRFSSGGTVTGRVTSNRQGLTQQIPNAQARAEELRERFRAAQPQMQTFHMELKERDSERKERERLAEEERLAKLREHPPKGKRGIVKRYDKSLKK